MTFVVSAIYKTEEAFFFEKMESNFKQKFRV
jgi:hypothetical protein